MGGKNHASLHVDGKEIFTVQLDEPGICQMQAILCIHILPTDILKGQVRKVSWKACSCAAAGKLSEGIARLRAEFMTKLNAHRGTNAHTADEGKLLLAICSGLCNQGN